jgi:GNAT superfamily N-acetyltransferase
MSHLTVEKLNTENRNAALSLINGAYDNVHGFELLTTTDLDTLEQSGLFALGSIDGKLVSFAYSSMVEEGLGEIRWAGVPDNFRGECHSLPPMQGCIKYLKDKGAKQIGVANWLDAPYRQMLGHFEREGIEVEHDHLILRIDMRNYTPQPPPIKAGYGLRTFREGDEQTWADVKNVVFGSSSTPEEFWTQTFSGVNKKLDFAPEGFFFAEKDGESVGICAGIVLHDRKKIRGTFPGVIGWTGVHEDHRGVGLGRALMVSSLNYLHDRGIAVTEIGTQFYRTAAVNLYEGLGFHIYTAWFTISPV